MIDEPADSARPDQPAVPAEVRAQFLETGANALEGIVPQEDRAEAVRRVLDALSVGVSVQQTEITSSQHVGPIPHPSTVRAYDEILPGAANRIFVLAEADQRAFIRSNSRKQWLDFAFKIACVTLGVAGLGGILYTCLRLAEGGHDAVAGTAVTALGIGVVTAIVNARMKQDAPSP